MSGDKSSPRRTDPSTSALTEREKELYVIVAKFLSHGPCKRASAAIIEDLHDQQIIPKRIDWLGNAHTQTYDEFSRNHANLSGRFLHDLVTRVEPLLQQVLPQIPRRQHSLLNSDLLRKFKDELQPSRTVQQVMSREKYRVPNTPTPNSALAVACREFLPAAMRPRNFLPSKLYARLQLFARNAGHLWAIYCLLYDRRGKYIITGADDMLVKIWSVIDGRLVASLRGASAEITDLAIDYDNTIVAAGSCDKIIRVWNLQTCAPIAVLSGHGGMIICLMFSPSPGNEGTLVSTGGDGCVAFWSYTKENSKVYFDSRPLKFNERIRPGHAQLICSSFSSGGNFLVIGGADHVVRVYKLKPDHICASDDDVDKILEMEVHEDRVDSIQWCHSGIGFISGSKDGTALIWRYKCQQWKTIKLNMTEVLPGEPTSQEEFKKLSVTMVGWSLQDSLVITASSDNVLRVWDGSCGRLKHCLKGHEDNAYVIEAHPTNARLILTAGHDGQMCIWDIVAGCLVKSFKNIIEGQGYGSLFDAKWAPDGLSAVATDSHGHILMFGIGQNDIFKKVPKELFFHTDYRPLMRDLNNHVLDEQTQLAPHLMPPPFLVNIDGNPYPPAIQRLVPGRHFCRDDQLVPNIILNDNGEREVVDPEEIGVRAVAVPPVDEDVAAPDRGPEEPNLHVERPNIDQMIRRLAQEQDQRLGAGNRPLNPDHSYAADTSHGSISPRAGQGARRDGDVEGVRHSTGDWQRGSHIHRKTNAFVAPLSVSERHQSWHWRRAQSDYELADFEAESRKRDEVMAPFKSPSRSQPPAAAARCARKPKSQRHAYSTRSTREADGSNMESPGVAYVSDEAVHPPLNGYDSPESSSESGSSTEYSDWTAGVDLQPPKRTAHKQKRTLVEARRRSQRRRAELLNNSDAGSGSSEPLPAAPAANRRQRRRPRAARPLDDGTASTAAAHAVDDIPDAYKPPEWLCETVPKKAPYFPQMGDELLYFQQGHQLYVEAVLRRKLYQSDNLSLPWHRRANLREQEYVKIIGIKYEIRPPRLCCLKLGILDGDGVLTGESFTIKYHDMADVLDFLVLKPAYDIAVSRDWKPGDKFRCIIDDAWWFGQVESHEPHVDHFPDSMFLCYRILWDNGERERLSPWDMEPIDEQVGIPERGGSVRVLPKEYKSLLYTNWSENWNERPFKSECTRIAQTLGQMMELSPAEPFLAPVDLSAYPNYAILIEYPMDLSTIKSRLENYFYRSPSSVQFDVRYIATNAEKFNEKGSTIVKNARIITDLCLTIIQNPNCLDPTAFYHQTLANYHSPNHSDSDGPSMTTRHAAAGRARGLGSSDEEEELPGPANTPIEPIRDRRPWKQQCSELLQTMYEREDSIPFRHPVQLHDYPDYHQVVDIPTDLTTVREELESDTYPSPTELAKEVRQIFWNSKNYNTNKRSRIYSMTLRLEAFFEDKLKEIVRSFKAQGKVVTGYRNTQRRRPCPAGGELAHQRKISLKLSRISHPQGASSNIVRSVWVSKNCRQAGPSTSAAYNGLPRSYFDPSSDDDDGHSERNKRRSRRVANLRRRRGHGGDAAAELASGSAMRSRSDTASCSKGGPVKRSSRRYEDDSDFEHPTAPPAAPAPSRRNSATSSSSHSKKSRRYEDDSDYGGRCVAIAARPAAGIMSSGDDDDDDGDELQAKTRVSQQASTSSSATARTNGLRGRRHRGDDKGRPEATDDEHSSSDDDHHGRPPANGRAESSVDTSKDEGADSEFECDDEDLLEESDDSEEARRRTKRKPPVVATAPRRRRTDRTVAGGSDDDQDFVVDQDDINSGGVSSTASESSTPSSGEPAPRPPPKMRRPSKVRRRQRKKSHKPPKKRNRPPASRPIHHRRAAPLTTGSSSSEAAAASDDSLSSAAANSRTTTTNQRRRKRPPIDDEPDDTATERGGGRVRKRVRYNEEDSDDDDSGEQLHAANVSSRGRVRRTNTRMKDFI